MTGFRTVLVKAADDHMIGSDDAIDVPCQGGLMAIEMACNIAGAVGSKAEAFNGAGLQVWTRRVMELRDGKIVRREVSPEEEAAYYEGRAA